MAAPNTYVDPTTTASDKEISQPVMKIQNTNLRLLLIVD